MHDIAIVGGGPGGLYAAYVLARNGLMLLAAIALLLALVASGVFLYARRFNRSRFDLVPVVKSAGR